MSTCACALSWFRSYLTGSLYQSCCYPCTCHLWCLVCVVLSSSPGPPKFKSSCLFNADGIIRLQTADVSSWMTCSFVMVNNDKREVMVLGPRAHRDYVSQILVSNGLSCTQTRNHTNLNLNENFSEITKSVIGSIVNIAKIWAFLSFTYAWTPIPTLVSTLIDYYNSSVPRLPKKSINRLQHVQNTAAWKFTRAEKYDHISQALASLH